MLIMLPTDFGIGAALAVFLNWLSLIPFRRSEGKHWTERARVLYPARVSAGWNAWLVPAVVVLSQRLVIPEQEFSWLPIALASWLGTLAGGYFFIREIFPSTTVSEWFRETLVTWGLSIGWWGFFITIAAVMPTSIGWVNWLLIGLYLAATICWTFGGLIWCLKVFGRVQPVPEKVRRIVESVSNQMQVPARRIWLMQGRRASAFAFPYTRDLFFSEELLANFPTEAIAAICANELGHLCESRFVLICRLSGSIASLPLLFVRPIFHRWGVGGVFSAAGAYWIGSLFLQKLARDMEVRADKIAKTYEGPPG